MYIICDEGLGRLMSTGRNRSTKEAAKEDLLHYLSGSCTRDELAALVKLSPDELAARPATKLSNKVNIRADTSKFTQKPARCMIDFGKGLSGDLSCLNS
jgi:hypothetical protein